MCLADLTEKWKFVLPISAWRSEIGELEELRLRVVQLEKASEAEKDARGREMVEKCQKRSFVVSFEDIKQ